MAPTRQPARPSSSRKFSLRRANQLLRLSRVEVGLSGGLPLCLLCPPDSLAGTEGGVAPPGGLVTAGDETGPPGVPGADPPLATETIVEGDYTELRFVVKFAFPFVYNSHLRTDTGAPQTDGTQGRDTGGLLTDGTQGRDTGGLLTDGTQERDTGGLQTDGTQGRDTGGLLTDGTQERDTGGLLTDGTQGSGTGAPQTDGTQGSDTGAPQTDGTQERDGGGGTGVTYIDLTMIGDEGNLRILETGMFNFS